MYDEQIYDDLRKKNPECFEIADGLYDVLLTRGMLAIRAVVARAQKNGMLEISRIEAISLERRYYAPDKIEGNVLLRLEFRAEIDFLLNQVVMLETALEVHGPTWNGNTLGKREIINQLGAFIHGWPEGGTPTPKGHGCLVLPKNVCVWIPAHHPLLLPYFSMCFGSFNESLRNKIENVAVSSTSQGAEMRATAIRSFAKRFGSFVVQAQRESAHNHFGTFF
jgi:hypothetical protein